MDICGIFVVLLDCERGVGIFRGGMGGNVEEEEETGVEVGGRV